MERQIVKSKAEVSQNEVGNRKHMETNGKANRKVEGGS